DSKDRLIATTLMPKLVMGEIALLEVVDVTDIGAFLDWGLEKDLFLPFKQQKRKILKGKSYLVGLYIDKSDRLCATMDIYDLLSSDAPYVTGDHVKGILYALNPERGGFVAVNGKYHGFIPNKELYGDYDLGKEVECRVTDVRQDGKLNLSLRKKAYRQMYDDSDLIFEALEKNNGFLPYNDKTDPELIKSVFNLSKRAYKRALGKLLKEGKITQSEEGIHIK
ncbi:MAG: RNA-binding protein, partial [Clostridia bacterium]|nr:RNA-binding protein [Clostridia bacterium]